MSHQNIIGHQLKHLRRSMGLNQDQLAARCCREGFATSENTISKIESGFRKVTDREIAVFAIVLKCNPGDFFPKTELCSTRNIPA